MVNNLDKAIYYFRKISDNENDIEKYIILADWKCTLDKNEQFTDSEYYLKNGRIRNRTLENHKYIPPTLYQKLWLEYKIDDKFLKSFEHIKKVVKDVEILNRLHLSIFPSYINFVYGKTNVDTLNFKKYVKKYRKYLTKYHF